MGRVFNVGGGARNARSVRAVAEMIEGLLEEPLTMVSDDWRTADQRYYVSDTSALQSLIGWTPRTSVQTGLARLYAWLQGDDAERPAAVAAAGRA